MSPYQFCVIAKNQSFDTPRSGSYIKQSSSTITAVEGQNEKLTDKRLRCPAHKNSVKKGKANI